MATSTIPISYTNIRLGSGINISSFPYKPARSGVVYVAFKATANNGYVNLSNGSYTKTFVVNAEGWDGYVQIFAPVGSTITISSGSVTINTQKFFPFI